MRRVCFSVVCDKQKNMHRESLRQYTVYYAYFMKQIQTASIYSYNSWLGIWQPGNASALSLFKLVSRRHIVFGGARREFGLNLRSVFHASSHIFIGITIL